MFRRRQRVTRRRQGMIEETKSEINQLNQHLARIAPRPPPGRGRSRARGRRIPPQQWWAPRPYWGPPRRAPPRRRQAARQSIALARRRPNRKGEKPGTSGVNNDPVLSWDPLANKSPVPVVNAVGPVTQTPAMVRTPITTSPPSVSVPAVKISPDGTTSNVNALVGGKDTGTVMLHMTSTDTGQAGLLMQGTAVQENVAPSDPQPKFEFLGAVETKPITFPKLHSDTSPGNIPQSTSDGRMAEYLRNVTDQLSIGGTMRVLRIAAGVELPASGSAGYANFKNIIDYVQSHPATATYSGNQLTEGKGIVALPVDQTQYQSFVDFNAMSSACHMNKDRSYGSQWFKEVKVLSEAVGFHHGKAHHFPSQAALNAHRANTGVSVGSGLAAVRAAHALGSWPEVTEADLSEQDYVDLQDMTALETYINQAANPAMSNILILWEPRGQTNVSPDESTWQSGAFSNGINLVTENDFTVQNTYELTIGSQRLAKYEPNSLLNSLAKPAPVIPLAEMNQKRHVAEQTGSFMYDVGNMAHQIASSIQGGLRWGAKNLPGIIADGAKIGGMLAPFL